ncbi:SAM-dependent methyltransferase [Metarhizobium album]|uniref:SAM-dependent methyltransferase n=2 Tax=Metarhizobium album TaxID=2182425 RepID=A0A2U2DYI1_9HYPH|nr:SAM-dependent methyltransferase [Rhizobium album]
MAASFPKPGKAGHELLIKAGAEGQIVCLGAQYGVASRLAGKGFLRRDPARRAATEGSLWNLTDRGREYLTSVGEIAVAVAAKADVPALAAKSGRAAQLLRDGDVMAARMLASGVYDEAQAAGRFASRFKARESLDACRRIQADALLIESRAMIRIAEEVDTAQDEGRVLKGRPKSISDENTFRLDDVGLTAQQVHAARKLAKAEKKQPGIVERAIQERLRAGLEPTRANLKSAIGAKTATREERGHNLYETPPEAMFALLAMERFSKLVAEPACGRGAISRALEAAGHDVILADIVDYGTADRDGTLQFVGDFMQGGRFCPDEYDIVTNPPYGDEMNAFMAHALRVHRPRKMALLLNWNAYGGYEDEDRNFVFEDMRPARVYMFKHRLPMMHRDGWDGAKASSSMNTAWFVWERQADGSYGQQTVLNRVDWADYMPAVAESEAA